MNVMCVLEKNVYLVFVDQGSSQWVGTVCRSSDVFLFPVYLVHHYCVLGPSISAVDFSSSPFSFKSF